MKIEYLNHMGDDLMVVNAARVSFDKESELEWKGGKDSEGNQYCWQQLKDSDKKLIHYLAKNNHWTPFAHPQLQVRVTVPIFIANQLKRHTIGLAVNEVSRRYVDSEPEFYYPKEWRKRPDKSIKQGSSDETIDAMSTLDAGLNEYYIIEIGNAYQLAVSGCEQYYKEMIKAGVCLEQARMILPQSMYTSWYWTGSLAAFLRIYKQRIDSHAQKEVQEIAKQLGEILKEYWPVSFEAWTNE